MISPQLIATLDQLPPDLQTEVLHYAEYLTSRQTSPPPTPDQPATIYRQAGSLKGMITMSPDFDAPLEDLQDYM
jgi:Protein of unknown function (DUF2281)